MGSKEPFYVEIMGAHPEVTGSSLIVYVRYPDRTSSRFVVDCGLFQEAEYNNNNKQLLFNPKVIDFCLITHNHVDHTGRIPFMIRNGYFHKIYMTEATKMLLPLALKDSAKVLKDIAKRKGEKPIYNDNDVQATMRFVNACEFEKPEKINDNITVTFFNNGHLIGAALILVQIAYPGYDDINLLFTGDYNNKNMFLDLDPLPEWVKDLKLTIVQEATYGDMDSYDIKESFSDNVSQQIEKKGTVLIPVFSLGRSQEILYEIKKMQESGKIGPNVPIYFDGKLAFEYTKLYLDKNNALGIKPSMRDFIPKNLTYVDKDNRGGIIADKASKIIVTTSGMGSYGPARTYISSLISRPDVLIHFTGYTAEGTIGRQLMDAQNGETTEVGGMMVCKRAEVKFTNEFSAHAKADEMIEFLQQFNHLKLVLVNHGETLTKQRFSKRILHEVKPKKVGILGGKDLFKINPYGLVETKPTKFI